MAGLTGWHLLALVVIIVLLFGAAKLPALAKSMGQSARVFKGEMKAMKAEDGPAEQTTADTTVASTAAETSTAPRPDNSGNSSTTP